MKKCFSCRNGENDVEADYLVVLTAQGSAPIRGYLCEDHLEMYATDGYTSVSCKPISAGAAWLVYERAREEMLLAQESGMSREDMTGLMAAANRAHQAWVKVGFVAV